MQRTRLRPSTRPTATRNLGLPYQNETKEDKAKHQADVDKNICLRYQAKTGQAKTGIGTDFCRAENETKAKNQNDDNRNLCLLYQDKIKEDKAK